jgi:hypothetical protein
MAEQCAPTKLKYKCTLLHFYFRIGPCTARHISDLALNDVELTSCTLTLQITTLYLYSQPCPLARGMHTRQTVPSLSADFAEIQLLDQFWF